jgi:hypothetical protein
MDVSVGDDDGRNLLLERRKSVDELRTEVRRACPPDLSERRQPSSDTVSIARDHVGQPRADELERM